MVFTFEKFTYQRIIVLMIGLFYLSNDYFLWAIEVSPVLNVQLLGGQYFFQAQESNLSGNVSLLAAPGIEVNDQWSFVPTFSASWRGTKSVQDLVGGGTLFQQTQDHSFNLKGIYTPFSNWIFKSGAGYRIQLLKETNDEKWGNGLFDFEKPSGNFEVEKVFSQDSSLRLGYDIYTIDFRNYSSLESQNRDLGRENAAARTLNTFSHSPYLSGKWAFPFFYDQSARLDASYYYTFRNYTQQKVVLLSGDLSGDLRKDNVNILTTQLTFPFVFSKQFKLLADIKNNFQFLSSNQNNYDAGKTKFNSNYYAYQEISIGPQFSFILGEKPYVFSLGFNYIRRNYSDRPVQDSAGTYGSDSIHVNEYYTNFGLSYPINKNFRAYLSGNLGWARSNMKYERSYRYNYETFAYLAGVIYDY